MNPTDDFQDALEGDAPDTDSTPSAPLDLNQATQWVAQVARIRRLREEYQQAHAAAVERLNERLHTRLANLAEQEEWFTEALTMYHRTVIAQDPEALTIYTPAGTLKSVQGQPKFIYEDEAALLEWAIREAGDVVDVPPTPDPKVNKTRLKKMLKEATATDGVFITQDGERVPGVRVEKAKRNFSVLTD